jgi:hypothetical protein
MTRPRLAAAAAAVAALSACSSPAPWHPAEPDTAAAAGTAAGRLLGYYAAGRFGQAWDMLTVPVQQQVPRATWNGFYGGCFAVTGVTYTVRQAVIRDPASAEVIAVVAVSTRGDGPPPGYPLTLAFDYDGNRWRYQPNSTAIWGHGSVAADLAAARAAGVC